MWFNFFFKNTFMFCVANAIFKINTCSAVPFWLTRSRSTLWRTQRKYVGVPRPSYRKINQLLQASGCVLGVDLDSDNAHTGYISRSITEKFTVWEKARFPHKKQLEDNTRQIPNRAGKCPFSVSGNPFTHNNFSVGFSHYRALEQTGTEAKRFKWEE